MNSNRELIKHLINRGALTSNAIIDAFEHVDRADFVLYPEGSNIYEDYPLGIGHNQTISQPATVAMMMEMLQPKKGLKVLDIGSGSGWTTALLSYIVGDSGTVLGLERVTPLVTFGSKNLQKQGFKNAKIIHSSDKLGIPDEKFDRILVSAAADKFPWELTEQLKEGGRLVIPVRSSIFEVQKDENGNLHSKEHYGFTFVPLIF